MQLQKLAMQAQKISKDNAPLILTGIAVGGSVLSVFQASRASLKAAKIISDAEFKLHVVSGKGTQTNPVVLSKKEKVHLVWKLYILPVSTLSGTIAATILSNRISTKRLAGLAVAYSLTEKNFEEYRDKIVEKLGVNKEQAARDELAQERVTATMPAEGSLIITGSEVLCFDQFSGRYFKSDIELIRRAENDINFQIVNRMYASVSDFYERIGLPATSYSEEIGWNTHHKLEVKYSTVLTPDGKPCVAIDFKTMPTRNFDYSNCMGDN